MISQAEFERTLKACPSVTPKEMEIALRWGVEAWANHAHVVDNYEGPAAMLATPGGLRSDRAMFLADIATGKMAALKRSPFASILPRLPEGV